MDLELEIVFFNISFDLVGFRLGFGLFCCGDGVLGYCLYDLYVINVIKVRSSAGWVACYIIPVLYLCMVCGPSAGCRPCFQFPYIPVIFSPCPKILQICNRFILRGICVVIPCIYSHGIGGRAYLDLF